MGNLSLHKSPPPLLQTTKVALEPIALLHIEALEKALKEGDIGRCAYLPMPYLNDLPSQIAQWQNEDRERGSLTYVVRWLDCAAHKQVVGMTRLFALHKQHRRAQIGGTWLVPRAQRQGVNRHAKWLLLQHGFERMQLARLEFVVHPDNTASMQALERIGAMREGLLRSYVRMNQNKTEQMQDIWMYSILRSDWLAQPFRTSISMTEQGRE